MQFQRDSGVLLHLASLPGKYGLGDCGDASRLFVDWLVAAGQNLWQILPHNPTGYGNSPYSAQSAFAINPLFISPDLLVADGLLEMQELRHAPRFPDDSVAYETIIPWKHGLLEKAFATFTRDASAGDTGQFSAFLEDHSVWLPDYALYTALKEELANTSWVTWPAHYRSHAPAALADWSTRNEKRIHFHEFVQYLLFSQWGRMQDYAAKNGVTLIGDIPFYVATDSADVWAGRDSFRINPEGALEVVSGVPPDFMSPTGAVWGTPLYDWNRMARDKYRWWQARISQTLQLTGRARLDHFRGFAACWEIPLPALDAATGRWVAGPGIDFFNGLREQSGALPLIAEDIGIITPDVEALYRQAGFPGIDVLQFAFSGGSFREEKYLPDRIGKNRMVHTAGHDNAPTRGWYDTLSPTEKTALLRYTGGNEASLVRDCIRLAFASQADTAIIPMQDILDLDGRARMNTPGRAEGNWRWRVTHAQLADQGTIAWLQELTHRHGR